MTRSIGDFHGLAVVIGCTHFHNYCRTPHLHENQEVFYTIDLSAYQNPDFVLDINDKLPADFKNRFKLTLLENLDCTAYNKTMIRKNEGEAGFNNIWEMTAEDGFIVIVGCPRQQEFRESVTRNKLNYIELDTDHMCILIPKNQNLSFEEVQIQIEKLEPVLRNTIDHAKKHRNATPNLESNFCKFPYKNMMTMRDLSSKPGDQVNEQRKQTKERQPQQAEVNINSSLGLMALSGLIAAAAIAFTVLNAATIGVAGIVLASIGVTLALSGMGLFAASAYKNRQKADEVSEHRYTR
jgi:hypothetical protein